VALFESQAKVKNRQFPETRFAKLTASVMLFERQAKIENHQLAKTHLVELTLNGEGDTFSISKLRAKALIIYNEHLDHSGSNTYKSARQHFINFHTRSWVCVSQEAHALIFPQYNLPLASIHAD
jgi:TolA-binding protein